MTTEVEKRIDNEFRNKTGILVLSGFNLTEIPGDVSKMTWLTTLNLFSNQITDLSPLQGLVNLKELSLWNNQIEDIKPLATLKKLEWLTKSFLI